MSQPSKYQIRIFVAVIAVLVALVVVMSQRRQNHFEDHPQPPPLPDTEASAPAPETSAIPAPAPKGTARPALVPTTTELGSLNAATNGNEASSPDAIVAPMILTLGNFDQLVQRCFDGEPCDIQENPWTFYQSLKNAGRLQSADRFISFLRKKLQDPKSRDRYRDILKSMIADFYPPEEQDFQNAAYYTYLGELKQSLKLYLDLEKKAAKDTALRPAPKLNIANVYYDLGRHKEALPYYKASLQDLETDSMRLKEQKPVIDFVRGRIDEIEQKVSR